MIKIEAFKSEKDEKLSQLIDQIYDKVEGMFSKDASGHSIDHLVRTLSYALKLQEFEGGDRIVIGIAAFVHDVHRIMQMERGNFVSPKDSLPQISLLLKDLDITEEQKTKILHAVEHHEEYNFGKEKVSVEDIESKILQDADNMDAIGAIGIIRTLKYSLAHNVVEYDPKVPFYRNDYSESGEDASTMHHIYNKLLRLGENMNTKTAREFAKPKIELMEAFLNMYVDEFKGRL